jgi:RHS repeat-associated protein
LSEVETTGSAFYGTHAYIYDAAGNLLYRGPAGATGELGLVYDRSATTPTHLAAIDQRVGGAWVQDVGLYVVNADGGVTARTKDSQLLTLWRNAEGWAQTVTDHATPRVATYHYDSSGQRSEKLVTGVFGVVLDARYYVDASFEVDTVNTTHEVHLFVGNRRVATSKRTGLGNTGGALTGSIASVTTYHSDQVGTNSVTTLSTSSAQTVSKTFLDPFGEKKSGTGTDPRYLFTDQERDAESGLDYFGARFYDAWAGRFIEQDPELVGAVAGVTFLRIEGDAGNVNGYAYTLNRPTVLIDPTGAFAFDPGLGGESFEVEGGGGGGWAAGEGFEDPLDESMKPLPRPDGGSRDPRGKGMPSSLPSVAQAATGSSNAERSQSPACIDCPGSVFAPPGNTDDPNSISPGEAMGLRGLPLIDDPEGLPLTREQLRAAEAACAADPGCAASMIAGPAALVAASPPGRAALEAGKAVARSPYARLNAAEALGNAARGHRHGKNFKPPGKPYGATPGAYVGYYGGYAAGFVQRLVNAADDVF